MRRSSPRQWSPRNPTPTSKTTSTAVADRDHDRLPDDGSFNQQLSPSLARKVGLVSFDPVLPDDTDKDLAEVIEFDPNPTNAKIAARGSCTARAATKRWTGQLTVNLSTYFDSSESRLVRARSDLHTDVLRASRPTDRQDRELLEDRMTV